MSNANDPFEEYLRKKKVELLENKFKTRTDDDGDYRPPTEDPEASARLEEEVADFMNTASTAGAQHFSEAGSGISDDKVGEIRDALDDVFEVDENAPSTETQDAGFVDFFKQVRTEYVEGEQTPAEGQAPLEAPVVAESVVAEAVVAEPVVDEPSLVKSAPVAEMAELADAVEHAPLSLPSVTAE
jgi:hypothetical protein